MHSNFESFETFCQHFNTESACTKALFSARWPNGYRCPSCRHHHYSHVKTRRLALFECRSCSRQTSIIAGTIMQGSSTSLTRWFQAMYLLAQPAGISATRLAEIIQVTYKTAWLIAHKIRHAMKQADAEHQLEGNVRIQRTYYGYLCFRDARQPILIGAEWNDHAKLGYVKIKQPHPSHVLNERRTISEAGLKNFIHTHLSKKANPVISQPINPYPSFIPIRNEATSWLNTTFQGIGAKHLQAYLDEFAFRLNQQQQSHSALSKLLDWCAITPVLIRKELIMDKPILPVPWTAWGGKNKWKGHHFTLWYA